jgi:hypothetical protein
MELPGLTLPSLSSGRHGNYRGQAAFQSSLTANPQAACGGAVPSSIRLRFPSALHRGSFARKPFLKVPAHNFRTRFTAAFGVLVDTLYERRRQPK